MDATLAALPTAGDASSGVNGSRPFVLFPVTQKVADLVAWRRLKEAVGFVFE
jgi:hypothetical protein